MEYKGQTVTEDEYNENDEERWPPLAVWSGDKASSPEAAAATSAVIERTHIFISY